MLNPRPNRVMVTTDAVGGVWRYSLELARGFVRLGTEVVLAVLGPAPTPAQRDEAGAIPGLDLRVTDLPLDWTADTPVALGAASVRLSGLAMDANVASVHLHTPVLVGSARWEVPVIAVAHSCVATWWQAVRAGALSPDLAWRAAAMARGLDKANAVVTPSASFAAALRHCYRLQRDIEVIHNGRAHLNANAQRRPVVLTAGRLWDEGKNIVTLDAAAACLSHTVQAAGPIAGPNGSRIRCRHLRLLGNLDEPSLAHAYAEAAVFASVARYEPFGLAVLEAAQAGCALVLSDIPTFRELWNGAATFVPPDDPVALADALATVLADPALCERRGTLARNRAQDFDPASMVAATWALHAAALTNREAA
jgi:glycosyltransferase involved in cell wall biosynthesis